MGFLSAGLAGLAQTVPLKAANWIFRPGAAEFGDSAGVTRLKILSSKGYVVLKNMDFGDATIEMDVIPTDPAFAQMYFRWQDSLESECFY